MKIPFIKVADSVFNISTKSSIDSKAYNIIVSHNSRPDADIIIVNLRTVSNQFTPYSTSRDSRYGNFFIIYEQSIESSNNYKKYRIFKAFRKKAKKETIIVDGIVYCLLGPIFVISQNNAYYRRNSDDLKAMELYNELSACMDEFSDSLSVVHVYTGEDDTKKDKESRIIEAVIKGHDSKSEEVI